MAKNELDEALDLVDAELKKAGISRREAFKLAGLGTAAYLMGGGQDAQAATEAKASSTAKGKILIIGGGLAGISTAARLVNTLSNPDITIVEPNPKSVTYQPGNTLVAAGIYDKAHIDYNTKDFVPKGVTLLKDKAVEFKPESNKVVLESGTTLDYDYLIVAAGLVLNFGAIKGLEEIGTAYSIGDSNILKVFGDSGVTSVYNVDSAAAMWEQMQKFIKKAKEGQKVKGVFTDPNTAIKCGGAPKKVMYLTNSRLNEANARANAELSFYADSGKLFGVKEYADAIEKQFIARDMKWNLGHNLTAVDIEKKIATFDKHWEEQGAFDKDLNDYEKVTKHLNVEVPFDFLHVTPPQKAPDEIGKSPIGSAKGWVPVDKETLQHVKYKNIFALGDIAAVPMAKTGGSVRKQYKVLVDNLISVMEGKEPTAKYAGYTVCPLITDIGKVMLAEFDWTAKPTPSFPLDPTQERWIWWLMKVYLLKPMTQYGMLSGKA